MVAMTRSSVSGSAKSVSENSRRSSVGDGPQRLLRNYCHRKKRDKQSATLFSRPWAKIVRQMCTGKVGRSTDADAAADDLIPQPLTVSLRLDDR
jgi:hypothetical protein